jgi:hypothetical protein
MLQARVLLSGLVIGESPRWHDHRLWFANWGTGEIVAVDPEGRTEIVGEGPPGLGWSIDWLPDDRLLITGEGLMRREPDGEIVPHADLRGLGAVSTRSSSTVALRLELPGRCPLPNSCPCRRDVMQKPRHRTRHREHRPMAGGKLVKLPARIREAGGARVTLLDQLA